MTLEKTIASYGSWKSPIKAELLVAKSVRLLEPKLVDNKSYWIESRPQENGRNMVVELSPQGLPRDLLGDKFSARSQCHEYGGASYTIAAGQLYFINASDQRIYRQSLNDDHCVVLSPEGEFRYSDIIIDQQRQRLICVREDHSQKSSGSDKEERNEIVALALDGTHTAEVLVSGADFYSNPCLSPDGKSLSWLCWHHPNMPWDATEVYLAQFDSLGQCQLNQLIAGGNKESIFQPQFGPDGHLYFVSDRSQWWNLYRHNIDSGQQQALLEMPAEFATPQWVFGMSCYAFLDAEHLISCYSQGGVWKLGQLNINNLAWQALELQYDNISMLQAEAGQALFFAANSLCQNQLIRWHKGRPQIIAKSSSNDIDAGYFSQPQTKTFTTGDKEVAHGFYYPPQNPDFVAPAGETPPLIVMCHGGPTGAAETALNLKIQFWTSRGFAIFDINYRGSVGYGRPYRDSLKPHWGIKDVDDVCAGANFLVDQGLADRKKLAIKGGSAGGYTVLAALTFRDTFAAGASHYGIGDLETLARDTHKFESRYLDFMVGPYPQQKALYQQRSPINHSEQLNCPVIFFQGLEDKVVPPNQAEVMVEILKNKGLPVAYVPFANEGHGFRGAEAIVQALEGELYFYSRVFGFELAESIPAIHIDNMDAI